jgi:O-antigen/teichoic acid export membrane protein
MLKGILSLVALGAGVYLTGSVLGGAVGLAVVWAGVLFFVDIRSGKFVLTSTSETAEHSEHLRPRWHPGTLARLSWLALPLGFVMMLISLNTNIPRYVIEQHLGERELGIFAALAYLVVAGKIVIGALGQSASPRMAQYYAAGNRKAYIRLLLKLVGIGTLLGTGAVAVAAVAGDLILTLLYGPEFAHQDLLVWLMVAAMLLYISSFLGYGMTAARYFRAQLPLFASVAAITLLVSLWLIPTYELYGAAVALMLSACIQILGSLAIIAYALRAPKPGESHE